MKSKFVKKSGIGLNSLFVALMVSALSIVSLEQEAQAQLILTINPRQGATNNTTIWTFSGSSMPDTSISSSIAPSSANTNHFGSEGWIRPLSSSGSQFLTPSAPARYNTATNHALTANTYSLPQITTDSGIRTISHIRLQNNASSDALGFRVSGTTSLSYANGTAVSWSGQGTLPHPISDFTLTAANEYFFGATPFAEGFSDGSNKQSGWLWLAGGGFQRARVLNHPRTRGIRPHLRPVCSRLRFLSSPSAKETKPTSPNRDNFLANSSNL